MPSKRNYQSEYRRRVERGLKRGLSRAQARGHARAGEQLIRPPVANTQWNDRLERALKALRKIGNQREAAKQGGVSVERFRRFIRESDLAKRQGRQWVFDDKRPRQIKAITTKGAKHLTVAGFNEASVIGKHYAAVGKFLTSNDASLLAPFKSLSVRDVSGRTHFLETRPNALYRLAAAGSETFEMIYRLTS